MGSTLSVGVERFVLAFVPELELELELLEDPQAVSTSAIATVSAATNTPFPFFINNSLSLSFVAHMPMIHLGGGRNRRNWLRVVMGMRHSFSGFMFQALPENHPFPC